MGTIIILFSAASCSAPDSKEVYLDRFEKFVSKVGENHNDYKKSDWDYADERFKKYSQEWHKKFKEELTLKEELRVVALNVKYEAYRGKNKAKDLYKEVLKEDVDKIKKKIKYYIDNDMDEDLEKLKSGAKEIGDSAVKVVNDIIHEFRK